MTKDEKQQIRIIHTWVSVATDHIERGIFGDSERTLLQDALDRLHELGKED